MTINSPIKSTRKIFSSSKRAYLTYYSKGEHPPERVSIVSQERQVRKRYLPSLKSRFMWYWEGSSRWGIGWNCAKVMIEYFSICEFNTEEF